jgi:hypothetical protein
LSDWRTQSKSGIAEQGDSRQQITKFDMEVADAQTNAAAFGGMMLNRMMPSTRHFLIYADGKRAREREHQLK